MVDLVERSLHLHCDNRATKLYYNSNNSSAKSKHIDAKFPVIKDRVRNHIVSVNSMSTILNISYPLTQELLPKSS